jgi:Domain of Unknown Function with PDB structure (DUF3857)/Transglutaminase-like superfamily
MLQTLLPVLLPALTWITAAPGVTRAIPTVPHDALYQRGEELAKVIEGAGTRKTNKGAHVVGVLDRTYVHVMESGLAHVTRRRVWKALSDRGGALLAVRRFDYDPATNVIRFLRIRVHRKGKAPLDYPGTRARDLAQPAGWIFWKTRMKIVGLPRLRTGDGLEVITYSKGFQIAYLGRGGGGRNSGGDERYVPPMRGHYYDTVLFSDDRHPVKWKTYRVTTPRKKPLRFKIYNGTLTSSMTFTKTRFVYDFSRRDIPRYKREPRAPAASDVVVKVVLATVARWPAKSRWFYAVNKNQFRANPAIRKKVREVLRGKVGRSARVTALLRWVAANIRYRGLSMGKGEGYTLHPGTRVFAHRAGVCKDIASMLVTMLRAAGYGAYPAMTMAGARVENVPADQFNHCVVALKKKRGGFQMLDPTWAPFSRQVWSNAERPQHYLVGTPRGEKLQRMAPQKGADNQLNVSAQTRLLGPRGAVQASIKVWGTGYPDTGLRRQMGSRYAPRNVRHFFERMAGRVAVWARVTQYAFGDFADLGRRYSFRMTLRASRYAQWGRGVVRFRPVLWNQLLSGAAGWVKATGAKRRTQPVMLRSTLQQTWIERIELPKGTRLAKPFQPVSMSHPGASLLVRAQRKGRFLTLTTQLILDRKIYPVAQHAGLKKVVDGLRGLRRRALFLVRTKR